jgi:hypothetical protein
LCETDDRLQTNAFRPSGFLKVHQVLELVVPEDVLVFGEDTEDGMDFIEHGQGNELGLMLRSCNEKSKLLPLHRRSNLRLEDMSSLKKF